MSISPFELYHGAVLSQVVRHPKTALKLIERKDNQGWASYGVTDNAADYLLYIKYASKHAYSKKRKKYNFTFSPQDISRLKKKKDEKVLVCLVCGSEEICLLDNDDLKELQLWGINKYRNVSVSWIGGSSLTVRSGGNKLRHKIARNRLKNFPWR